MHSQQNIKFNENIHKNLLQGFPCVIKFTSISECLETNLETEMMKGERGSYRR
jgi:hypothetical protein